MPTKRTNERPIDLLSSKHTMSILMFLHDNGPSRRIDIYEGVSKNGNMPEKIQRLIELGLVRQDDNQWVSTFSLTLRGELASEYLGKIESVIIDE